MPHTHYRILAVLIAILVGCRSDPPHVTDLELRSRFAANSARFAELKRIATEPVHSIEKDGVVRSLELAEITPIKTPLWQRAWPLMTRLGIQEVIRDMDGDFTFIVSESNDSGKGYRFVTHRKPENVVRSLDNVDLQCEQLVHAPVTGDWYLYLYSYCS